MHSMLESSRFSTYSLHNSAVLFIWLAQQRNMLLIQYAFNTEYMYANNHINSLAQWLKTRDIKK